MKVPFPVIVVTEIRHEFCCDQCLVPSLVMSAEILLLLIIMISVNIILDLCSTEGAIF